jgi:hypothetical protein
MHWPRTPSQRTTHHTDCLAGSLGLSCLRGASLDETIGEDHRFAPIMPTAPATRCSLRIIGMLWTGRSCRRRQCSLWRKGKRATGPADAPKLRQNRFKCNGLLHLNRGLPETTVYDLNTVRQPEVRGEISSRIKCSSLRFKCNSLLYLNRGLPGSAVYDLSTVRHT